LVFVFGSFGRGAGEASEKKVTGVVEAMGGALRCGGAAGIFGSDVKGTGIGLF